MGEAAVLHELAHSSLLEVATHLGLVVAVDGANIVSAWIVNWHWLRNKINRRLVKVIRTIASRKRRTDFENNFSVSLLARECSKLKLVLTSFMPLFSVSP